MGSQEESNRLSSSILRLKSTIRLLLLCVVVLSVLHSNEAVNSVLLFPYLQLEPLVNMTLIPNATLANDTCNSVPCSCALHASEEENKFNVTCDKGNYNITSLHITKPLNNGSIPSTINQMWALQNLTMSGVGLSSTIPTELGLDAFLTRLDLSNNNLNGSLPESMFILTSLADMKLDSNLLSSTVSSFISQLTNLSSLNLARNNFIGPVLQNPRSLTRLIYLNISGLKSGGRFSENLTDPSVVDSFKNLTKLQSIDLSYSNMYGGLASINWTSLEKLTYLDLRNMTLNYSVLPTSFAYLTKLDTSTFHPPNSPNYTCPPCSKVSSPQSSSVYCTVYCPKACKCKSMPIAVIVGIVLGASAFVIVFLLLVYRFFRAGFDDGVAVQGVRRFTMQQLEEATENFTIWLGKGGFGEVFKGTLDTGELVAVKRTVAKQRQKDRKEFDSGFRNEILVLSGVRHRNLVELLGYCSQRADLLLVYEFMARGSLDDILKKEREEDTVELSWERRLKLAFGAAQGLDYLHSGVQPPIIHRDIKSSNILVAEDFVAKVADFGLSKIRPEDEERNATHVKGTPGYLDPSYLHTGRPTAASDVYSFGVVLLELATGWKPVGELKHITNRVAKAVNESGNFESIIAPAIRRSMGQSVESSQAAPAPVEGSHGGADTGEGAAEAEGEGLAGVAAPEVVAPFSLDLFERFVRLGMRCCSREPDQRPPMRGVVKALNELMEGRTDLTAEVTLSEGAFEEEKEDEVVVMTHNLGDHGSTVAFVMESGLIPR